MEQLRAVALEEIALEGRRGCPLPQLWQLIEARLPLDGISQLLPVLRQHLWQQLRADTSLLISTQQLQAAAKEAADRAPAKKPPRRKKKTEDDEEEAGADTLLAGRPASSLPLDQVPADVQQAEAQHIVLVAPEYAWLSAVGVFDELHAAQKLSAPQLQTLEIVGQSRIAGAVSSEMAKELGIQNRNFFYVLKMLEARNLIVRSKLMLPDGKGNSGWTTTQLIHLPKYAPRMAIGSEAIIREVKAFEPVAKSVGPSQPPADTAAAAAAAAGSGKRGANGGGNRLVVRDDAATLKEICDFLAQQGAGKYVSESQVKTVLGFTGSTPAHRQWRRLRMRLLKLGCISLETGLLGNKALSVLKLLKPYKLKVPVVVDSDEDELQAELDEAADAEEEGGAKGGDADTPAAAAAGGDSEGGGEAGEGADATAAAAGGGEEGGSSGAKEQQGIPVEVGRDQMLLEFICEAGPEGVLTPDLTKRMGISPKLFLKGLPDMCKRYGVQTVYDMNKKTITNRITAPQHLLEAYARQQAVINPGAGLTRAPSGAVPPLPPVHTPAAAAGGGAGGVVSAGLPPRPPAAAAGSAGAGASQQQQAALSRQDSGTLSTASEGAAFAPAAAAADSDAMDVDAMLDAVADEVIQQCQQQQPEVPADVAAAAAAASAAAAAGVAGASVTRGINQGGGSWGAAAPQATAATGLGPGRRSLMGVSRHQLRRLDALRQRLAEHGFVLQMEVRSVIVEAENRGQPDKPPTQPSGSRKGEGPDTKTCARLVQHLLDADEVQLTRLQYNQELVTTTREVDVILPKGTELTPELLQRIAAYNSTIGRAIRQRSIKRREVLLQTAKVLGVADTQEAEQAALEMGAPRAFLISKDPTPHTGAEDDTGAATGAGKAAAAAAAAQPAAAAAAEPEKHQLHLLMPGPNVRRRLRGFRSLAVLQKARAAQGAPQPAAAGGSGAAAADAAAGTSRSKAGGRKGGAADSPEAHFPATARRAGSIASLGGSVMATLGRPDSSKGRGQDASKGAAMMQMHHNGYIPSLMLRAKLLHQYLAGTAHLAVDPHDDIDKPPAAAAGAAAGAPRRQLRFVFERDDMSESDKGEVAEVLPQALVAQKRLDEAPPLAAPPAAAAAAAANSDASGGVGPGGAEQQQQEQRERLSDLEQQLGGRILSVQDIWNNMPLALALQVAGIGRTVTNLTQLVCQTEPPPRIRDFDHEQIAAAFEERAWNRVLTALSILSRMKLLTCARRKRAQQESSYEAQQQEQQQQEDNAEQQQEQQLPEAAGQDDPSQGWVQSEARLATHLVVAATGVMDLPPFAVEVATAEGAAAAAATAGTEPASEGAEAAAAEAGGGAAASVALARVSYDFRQAGQWRAYWAKMQAVFDSPLMTPQLVAATFPGKVVPDVARHRSWVWYRGLTMKPWLRLIERIQDLPIQQLDQHLARTLADELGVPYQPVQIAITRWRTEANEERERRGLSKVYLLEHKAAEAAAAAAQAADQGLTANELRRHRISEHKKRRLQRQQQSDAARRAKAAGRPIQRGRGRKPQTDSQRDLAAAAAAAAAGAAAAASLEGSGSDGGAEEGQAGVQGRRGRPKTPRAGRARGTSVGSGEEGGEGDASAGSDSFSDVEEDYGTRPRASGLPQIVFRLTPPSADEVSKPISGRRQFKAQQGKQPQQQQAGDGARGEGQQAAAAAAAGGEGGAVPQRHRWTPDEDKQLLRWLMANRVELGTRDTIRWSSSATAALPLGQELCARRLAFFKRKPKVKLFVDNLQAQARQIHLEFSSRRHALRQQLQRLQQQRRLSVNPLLLREAAAGKKRLLAPKALQPKPLNPEAPQPLGPLELPPPPGQPGGEGSAAAAGGEGDAAAQETALVSEAAAVLASAGPYALHFNGSIVLLPDASIQARLKRMNDLIDDFAAPRQVGRPGPRGFADGMGPARRQGGEGGGGRKRKRLQRPHAAASDDDVDHDDASSDDEDDDADGLGDDWSSGESDQDEFQLQRAAKRQRLLQQRRAAAAAAGKGGSGGRRRTQQVAPLKTVADQVAAMAALQTAAAAAAAAALAQRRAAGEVVGPEEEAAEVELQLLRLKKASRKRSGRKQQQQQPPSGSDAISDPKALLQVWRRHQAVETRPSAAAGATQQQPAAEGGSSAAAGGPGGVSRPWKYGVAPTLPVLHAMYLIVSLLQLVEVVGSLPADVSTALLVRFSQAEVAAAFRWLSGLGWVNAGAAKRGFQLSRSWAKHMKPPDRTLADLMDRAPAAALALQACGLMMPGATQQVGQHQQAPGGAAAEGPAAAADAGAGGAAGAAASSEPAAAGAEGSADAGKGAGQAAAAMLAAVGGAGRGGRTLVLQAAFDLEEVLRQCLQQPQQQRQPSKQAPKQDEGVSQEAAAPAAAAEAAEAEDAMDVDAVADGTEVAADAAAPAAATAENSAAPASAPAGTDAPAGQTAPKTTGAAAAEPAAAAAAAQSPEAGAGTSRAPSTSSSSRVSRAARQLEACRAVLHPRPDHPGSFWVGALAPAAAAEANGPTLPATPPAAAAVPGALLLQLLCGAAMGHIQLQLCCLQQGSGGALARAGAMVNPRAEGSGFRSGSILNLLRKAPTLLVSASTRPTHAPAAAVTEVTVVEEAPGAPPAASDPHQQQQLSLVPMAKSSRTGTSSSSSSRLALLAYAAAAPPNPATDAAAPSRGSKQSATEPPAAAAAAAAGVGAGASPSKRKRGRAAATAAPQAEAPDAQPQQLPASQAQDAETPVPAAGHTLFSPLAVGGDDTCRQEAEAACLAAAAAAAVGTAGDGVVAEDATTPERPQKRQRKQAADASKSSGHDSPSKQGSKAKQGNSKDAKQSPATGPHTSSSRRLPDAAVLSWLLGSIRAAGSVGVSQQQLVEALESTQGPDQTPDTPQPAEADTPTAAAAAAAAAAPTAAAAAHPGGASGAVAAGVGALCDYGLIRTVSGWQGAPLCVAAEHSNSLMAWPAPSKSPGGPAGPAAAATPAAAAAPAGAPAASAADREAAGAPQPDSSATASGTAAAADGSTSDGILLTPWLDHRGSVNRVMWQGLVKRLVGVVLRNPGIPEPLLLAQMDAVNPAAAQEVIRVLVAQQHLIAREVSVATAGAGGGGDSADAAAGAGGEAAAGGSVGSGSSSSNASVRPALKLGMALDQCLAARPAKPPSFLLGGRRAPATAAAAAGDGGGAAPAGAGAAADGATGVAMAGGSSAGMVGVRHFWPSLLSSSVCHLTVLPPCRTAAAAGV